MVSIAVPTFILAAHCVCMIEENMFIEAHKTTGAVPTPRYFDPNSWLAYDATTGVLTGAD